MPPRQGWLVCLVFAWLLFGADAFVFDLFDCAHEVYADPSIRLEALDQLGFVGDIAATVGDWVAFASPVCDGWDVESVLFHVGGDCFGSVMGEFVVVGVGS